MEKNEIIIYNTDDGKTSVAMMVKDGNIWLNQQMCAKLFDASVPNIKWRVCGIH